MVSVVAVAYTRASGPEASQAGPDMSGFAQAAAQLGLDLAEVHCDQPTHPRKALAAAISAVLSGRAQVLLVPTHGDLSLLPEVRAVVEHLVFDNGGTVIYADALEQEAPHHQGPGEGQRRLRQLLAPRGARDALAGGR